MIFVKHFVIRKVEKYFLTVTKKVTSLRSRGNFIKAEKTLMNEKQ